MSSSEVRTEERRQQAPAISYGLGPPLSGFLAGYCGVMSPLTAVSILATVIAILSWYNLTEDAVKLKQVNDGRVGERALNDEVDGHVPTARAGLSRNLSNKTALYMTVFIIGLLANAMYMMVFLIFPLVLKDEFSFSPFQAGMTGIGDGVLAILGNWLYMYLATKICIRVSYICLLACSSGVVACLATIFFDSILGFLTVRYAMGLACPLIFTSLPQIVAMISPRGRGGEFMGYLNMFLSIGNVIPTPVDGPLYEHVSHSINFYIASMLSSFSALLFLPILPILRNFEHCSDSTKTSKGGLECIDAEVAESARSSAVAW